MFRSIGIRRVLASVLPLALAFGIAVAQPSSAKTLRYAVQTFGGETFDPTLTAISTSLGFGGPLWDWLTIVDKDGKLHPGLATSWKGSPDNKTWTFTLRKGVKFHDGTEMTAEDLKFTLEVGFGRKEAHSSRAAKFRKAIKSVDVVDRYTARINANKAWPTFPFDISNQPGIEGIVLPKAYIEKVGWKTYGQKPISTGVWRYVKHETGNYVEFEAVKNHWRYKNPAFDRLRMQLVPEGSTRVAMLKTGQVDIADISLDDVKDLKAAGFNIVNDPQPSSVRIHLYGSYYKNAGPIGKLKVRKALNLAINRQELVDTLLYGQGKPAAVFPISPLSIGYPADLKPYRYDPAEARRLLAAAGYPNGFRIKLYAVPTGGFTLYKQVTEVVAGYWEAIGVKAEIIPTDMGTFRPMFIKKPQDPKIVGQASVFTTTSRLNGATGLGIWWTAKRKILQLAGNVDGHYTKASKAGSVKEIAKLVNDAYHIIYNDYRGIPLADVDGVIWALGNRAKDVTMTPHRGYLHPSLGAVTAR